MHLSSGIDINPNYQFYAFFLSFHGGNEGYILSEEPAEEEDDRYVNKHLEYRISHEIAGFIRVRIGKYLTNPFFNDIHWTCPPCFAQLLSDTALFFL
jgi:hypothetical protein